MRFEWAFRQIPQGPQGEAANLFIRLFLTHSLEGYLRSQVLQFSALMHFWIPFLSLSLLLFTFRKHRRKLH